jgi:hypothetical protein
MSAMTAGSSSPAGATATEDDPAMRAALIAQIGKLDFRKALGARNSSSFFVRLGPLVAAVGVAQVRRSDGSGTPRGYVLMARRITSAQLSSLLQLTARLDLAVSDTSLITPSRETMLIAVPILGARRPCRREHRLSPCRATSRRSAGAC